MVDKYFSENYNELLVMARGKCKRFYEDLLHDVYIECKKSEHNIRNPRFIKSYINTIMNREAIKYYEIDNKEGINDMVDLIDEDNDLTDMYLNEMLEKLNFEEQVIVLYLIEGFNQREISEMMEIKYSTLRDKVQRIRVKLESKRDY